MNRYVHISALVPLLFPALVLAGGETVPCPEKKSGQWYRFAKTDMYKNTTTVLTKIDRVDGERLVQNSGDYVTDLMYNWYKLGERVAKTKFFSTIECPFSLGETRVYKDVEYDGVQRGSRTRGTFTVTVDPEFTTVTVKAGSFRTVRIVSDLSATGTDDRAPAGVWGGTVRFVSYYAPKVGISVRSEASAVAPISFRDVLELIEYSPVD